MKEISRSNTKAALSLISKDNRGSIFKLNDTIPTSDGTCASVFDILKSKHPQDSLPTEDSLVDGAHNPPIIHPVIYDNTQGKTICSAALCTSGAVAPSGIDAQGWRSVHCSFKSVSDGLCHSLHFSPSSFGRPLSTIKPCLFDVLLIDCT